MLQGEVSLLPVYLQALDGHPDKFTRSLLPFNEPARVFLDFSSPLWRMRRINRPERSRQVTRECGSSAVGERPPLPLRKCPAGLREQSNILNTAMRRSGRVHTW